MELTAQIETLLAEKFSSDPDFADCFVVETKLGPAKLLEVFVDADGAMDFSRCQRISRFLESHLDENKWLGEDYTLEVSSPGIGRPLKFLRQYVKNIGRTVEVTLADGPSETGVLKNAGEAGVTISQQKQFLEGKKKVKKVVETEIPFDKIKQTAVVVVF